MIPDGYHLNVDDGWALVVGEYEYCFCTHTDSSTNIDCYSVSKTVAIYINHAVTPGRRACAAHAIEMRAILSTVDRMRAETARAYAADSAIKSMRFGRSIDNVVIDALALGATEDEVVDMLRQAYKRDAKALKDAKETLYRILVGQK